MPSVRSLPAFVQKNFIRSLLRYGGCVRACVRATFDSPKEEGAGGVCVWVGVLGNDEQNERTYVRLVPGTASRQKRWRLSWLHSAAVFALSTKPSRSSVSLKELTYLPVVFVCMSVCGCACARGWEYRCAERVVRSGLMSVQVSMGAIRTPAKKKMQPHTHAHTHTHTHAHTHTHTHTHARTHTLSPQHTQRAHTKHTKHTKHTETRSRERKKARCCPLKPRTHALTHAQSVVLVEVGELVEQLHFHCGGGSCC